MTSYGKRPRKLNYAVNHKRPTNNSKIANAIKHYLTLKKKVSFEGETKWLKNAFLIVEKKLKKYGINVNNI